MTGLVLMSAHSYRQQFDEARLARLRRLLPTTEPVRVDDVDELDQDALDQVQVMLTGWGAPPLDPARLARLPRLTAVIHCAGSVKSVVTGEVWRRGLRVCSAAESNCRRPAT